MSTSQPRFCQQSLSGDTLVIGTDKALDNTNAQDMLDTITTAQRNGIKFIILDMKQLEFLSSSGVGSIIGTVEAAREKGGDIILCNLSPIIRHVFNVLDLSDYLTITSDTRSAESLCRG